MPSEIEQLLPHQPPMRWIDALTGCTDTTAIATACLTEDSLSVDEGWVLESALVECVAQTVAAAMGRRARTHQRHAYQRFGFSDSRPRAGRETVAHRGAGIAAAGHDADGFGHGFVRGTNGGDRELTLYA
jgi:predicted hotdog family 3-hydroxylacyl-ACP dehydratase